MKLESIAEGVTKDLKTVYFRKLQQQLLDIIRPANMVLHNIGHNVPAQAFDSMIWPLAQLNEPRGRVATYTLEFASGVFAGIEVRSTCGFSQQHISTRCRSWDNVRRVTENIIKLWSKSWEDSSIATQELQDNTKPLIELLQQAQVHHTADFDVRLRLRKTGQEETYDFSATYVAYPRVSLKLTIPWTLTPYHTSRLCDARFTIDFMGGRGGLTANFGGGRLFRIFRDSKGRFEDFREASHWNITDGEAAGWEDYLYEALWWLLRVLVHDEQDEMPSPENDLDAAEEASRHLRNMPREVETDYGIVELEYQQDYGGILIIAHIGEYRPRIKLPFKQFLDIHRSKLKELVEKWAEERTD